jgi:Tol biopolymer transport system component
MTKSSRYPQTMATQSRNLLRLALGVALLLSLALLAFAFAAARAAASPVTYNGIAADGHLALFTTTEKMVPGDTDNQPDVYVRSKDEALGEQVTREVSIGPAGGNDAQPVQYDGVSSDGEKVFFSTKEGLVASDKDGQEDIYMRNLETNATTLVSQRDSSCATEGCGGPLAGAGFVPGGVIPSGDRVFFATTEKLSGEDGDGALDVYMRDLGTGETVLISQGDSSCAGSGCGDGPLPAIFKKASEDGEKVFFTSTEGLATGDGDGRLDIYERDLETTGSTVLVSPLVNCPAGLPSGQNCDPSYRGASSDGSHVFFESNEQISGADTDTSQDVYDWSGSGPAALVSTGPSGGNGAPNATYAGTSGTGAQVYFETSERVDPVADTDAVRDVYERSGGETTTLISTGPVGGNGPQPASFEWASPDGSSSAVLFSTTEALTSGDTDTVQDIYSRSGTETTLVSTGPESRNGPQPASFAGASDDGSHVYFLTVEALLGEDKDANADIYLRSGTETALVSTGTIGGNGAFSAGLFGVSTDGSMGFFVTRERLAADDDFLNEEDVYSWAAPKSPGSSSKTLLVSVKNSGELVLGPPPPFLEGTSPATSGETTEPRILGQAEAEAVITIYTTSNCSGKAVPPGGSEEELAGAGIPVTVAAATKTTFYATAEVKGIVSPCSNGVSYTQATPEPPPPPPPPAGEEGGNKGGGGTTTGGTGTGGNGTGGGGGNGRGFTFVTPQTRITFGPASKTRKRKVVFRFVDSTEQPGTKFLCKADRKHWKECGSPDTLKRLSVGRHVFQVKAVNALGTAEPAPQKRAFKVVK